MMVKKNSVNIFDKNCRLSLTVENHQSRTIVKRKSLKKKKISKILTRNMSGRKFIN